MGISRDMGKMSRIAEYVRRKCEKQDDVTMGEVELDLQILGYKQYEVYGKFGRSFPDIELKKRLWRVKIENILVKPEELAPVPDTTQDILSVKPNQEI